ncbi:MAG: VOC family protein [Pseudomonadota bacterium]
MSFAPDHFIAWIEIPVSDLSDGIAFYQSVTGGRLDRLMMGPQEVAVLMCNDPKMGVSANLVQGQPSGDGKGPTVHVMVAGVLEDAMARAADAGGRVLSEPIPIPEGRFAYIHDPDGNSIALFEAA